MERVSFAFATKIESNGPSAVIRGTVIDLRGCPESTTERENQKEEEKPGNYTSRSNCNEKDKHTSNRSSTQTIEDTIILGYHAHYSLWNSQHILKSST